MKILILYKKEKSLVDDDDFEILNKNSWYLDSTGYASNSKLGRLHRFLMKAKKGQIVDHINRNKLDNRKENLRFVTQSQNMVNRDFTIKNTSGYKGVTYLKTKSHKNRHKKWTASIKYNYKKYTKYFFTKEEAAKGYNELAIKYFGTFAKLNKII